MNGGALFDQVGHTRDIHLDAAGFVNCARKFDDIVCIRSEGGARRIGAPLNNFNIAGNRTLRPIGAAPPVG